jgi:Protein of unknown function (DUF5661)
MKKNIFLQIAVIVIMGFAFMLVVNSHHAWGQTQLRQSVEGKFEDYRKAIKESYRVDIKNFKDKLKGGYGDGKLITNYDLEQLLAGIKVELEHTSNQFIALELAMDHLERIPDYYERLFWLEREAMAAKGQERQKVEGKFEDYRKAIKDAFQIDIKNFKDNLKGGVADGKAITKYELGELLEGIKWERQHANDSFIALELAMDHLERIPDYFSRVLCRLERECVSDRLLRE